MHLKFKNFSIDLWPESEAVKFTTIPDADGNGVQIRFACNRNHAPEQSPVCEVTFAKAHEFRMLTNSMTFGYPAGLSKTVETDNFFGDMGRTISYLYTLLFDAAQKEGLWAGFLPPVNDDSLLEFKEDKLLCHFYQTPPPHGNFNSDVLHLRFGRDPNELALEYAAKLPRRNRQSLANRNITGWNSWDYYFQTVTEEDVDENLTALKKDSESGPQIDYIILDDGWQNGYGDWEVSSRFHDSLEQIVEKIRNAGFKPGIWVAPFLADYYSKLSLRHPEMLARQSDGRYDFLPGGNGGFGVVDPTAAETEAMLTKLFRKLRKIGFEYFKIDFIHYVYSQGLFCKPMRKIELINHGLRLIRQAVGEDAILTGCGCPVYCGYGIVDNMRISADISTYWSNILSSARELASSWFFHRASWVNDPDFLIVRSPLTTDEKQYNPFFLPKSYQPFESRSGEAITTLNEIQVWCALVVMSGGNIILGDRFSALNETGKKLIGNVLKNASGAPGVPLDFFENGIPSKWVQRKVDRMLFAFFNWEDQEKEIIQEFGGTPCRGFDIWNEVRLDFPEGVFHEIIPSRTVRMIEILH